MIITAACLLLFAIVAVGMMYVMRANFQFGPHFFCTPNFTNRQLKKNGSAYISNFHTNLINDGHLMLFQSLPSRSPPRHFSLSKFKGRGISPTK